MMKTKYQTNFSGENTPLYNSNVLTTGNTRKLLMSLCIKVAVLSIAFLFLSATGRAEKKKEVKKHKIKSVSSIVTENVKGKDQSYKDSYTRYDGNGNVVEEVELNADGTFKKKETYAYNKNKDVTEHVTYNADGSIKKRIVNVYNSDNEKIEVSKFDKAGKLIEKEVSTYDPKGLKTSEILYNDKGEVTEKSTYSYDKKGLRTEKRTTDGRGVVIAVKKYAYEF